MAVCVRSLRRGLLLSFTAQIQILLTAMLMYQITLNEIFDVHLLPLLKTYDCGIQRSIINAEAKIFYSFEKVAMFVYSICSHHALDFFFFV